MKTHDNGRPFALVQISDTHLFADPETCYRGWNTDAALEAVLAHLRADRDPVDAILLTGDLAEDESPAAYVRLREKFSDWSVPCYALPGNHDDPAAMRQHLGMPLLGSAALGSWRLLLLDSRVAGKVNGRLADAELERAERFLSQHEAPCLLAVHHPPLAINSPWMDSIGLDNGSALLDRIRPYSNCRAIVFGHAHQRVDQRRRGLRLLGCPSTWRQFLPGAVRPAEDPRQRPGYRRLWLHDDGRLATRIRRLPCMRPNERKIE